MNLSATFRQVIAIVEEYCRSEDRLTPQLSFEVKPQCDQTETREIGSGCYDVVYRIFQVHIQRSQASFDELSIVLIRNRFSRIWDFALIESLALNTPFYESDFRASYIDGRWALKKLQRIAYGHEGVLDWDKEWLCTRSHIQARQT